MNSFHTFFLEDVCIHYLPIHLNTVIDSDFYAAHVSDTLIDRCFQYVKKIDNTDIFILDFDRMTTSGKILKEHVTVLSGYNILLINLSKELSDKILLNECSDIFETIEGLSFSRNFKEKLYNTLGLVKNTVEELNKWLDLKLINILSIFLKQRTKTLEEPKYLHSSGIYANMYVNLKELFNIPHLTALAVYLICKKISRNTTNYTIVSASNTGSVLANIIGKLMLKDNYYLRNLGPKVSIRDKELIDNLPSYCQYIFVYDFLCMGSEQRLVEMFLKLKQSELLFSIGVAEFKSFDRSESNVEWISLFNVDNDFFAYEVQFHKKPRG